MRLLVVVSLLLAGCATVPLDPTTQDALNRMTELAERTSRVYRLPYTVKVYGEAHTGSTGAVYRRGAIFIRRGRLTAPHMLALMAHELGHAVNGDEAGMSAGTTAEWFAVQYEREVKAHVAAVDILQRAGGLTREQALRTMQQYLAYLAGIEATGGAIARGHKPACEEWADTLVLIPDTNRASYPCPLP